MISLNDSPMSELAHPLSSLLSAALPPQPSTPSPSSAVSHQRVQERILEGAVSLAGGQTAEHAHQADPVARARRLQRVVDGQQTGHARLGDVRLVRVRRRTWPGRSAQVRGQGP